MGGWVDEWKCGWVDGYVCVCVCVDVDVWMCGGVEVLKRRGVELLAQRTASETPSTREAELVRPPQGIAFLLVVLHIRVCLILGTPPKPSPSSWLIRPCIRPSVRVRLCVRPRPSVRPSVCVRVCVRVCLPALPSFRPAVILCYMTLYHIT